ncbi:MAG: oligosaccharide flippase family protein [Flavobacteriales bacterium]|nr:oligosaccharide flippase family protein [Flavobacteriales bacterium]
MNPLKKLAGQTAIYGLSSIIGRFLNFLLIPLYTHVLPEHEYGVVTEMYTYLALLIIILTYGMETAYFRFSESTLDKKKVYATALTSLILTSLIFLVSAVMFSSQIAAVLGYPDNTEYVVWFAMIIAFDAISAIPFAKLRSENKATAFATIKLVNISINIGLNLLFILAAPHLFSETLGFNGLFLGPRAGVGYIFIANLVASSATLLLLFIWSGQIRIGIDLHIWKEMLVYALPLLILGVAGSINETLDRLMLKYRLPLDFESRMAAVGVYGACYKLAMILTLFVQSFRYAAEPFYFSHEKEKDALKTYANIMTYFSAVCGLIFLAIMVYMDIVKTLIGERYHVGLKVVPIILLANVFLGFFYNLSIWYKLRKKTFTGAMITVCGAAITIVGNYFWIPAYGYMASAWVTLVCYMSMAFLSYWIGKKHLPVPYHLPKVIGYIILALGLYYLNGFMPEMPFWMAQIANTFFIFVYLLAVISTNPELLEKLKTLRRPQHDKN